MLNLIKKTEGTSQTYGQLFVFNKQEQTTSKLASEPKNINIVIPVLSENSKLPTSISDVDKLTIFYSAINDSPSVQLTSEIIEDTVLEISLATAIDLTKTNSKITKTLTVAGNSFKTKDDLKLFFKNCQKVDTSFILLRSQESEPLEYNSLKELDDLEADFIYNFYDPNEKDIFSQEDPNQDPVLSEKLFNVPRYVKLKWNSIHVENILIPEKGIFEQNKDLDAGTKQSKQKITNILNSFKGFNSSFGGASISDQVNKIIMTIGQKEIIDLNNLQKAFDSTQNKNRFMSIALAMDTISRFPLIKIKDSNS